MFARMVIKTKMNGNLVIEYHAIITWLIVACLGFIFSTAIGTYISQRIKNKMNPPKEALPGSVEFCANCKAVSDIPAIKKKQEDRDVTMNELGTTIAIIQAGITSLDERVKKIFNMIEKGYKDEIAELRQALREEKAKGAGK